jgi:D-glycero-D-manno-heptose 1,7-bisphosphate phosphatase
MAKALFLDRDGTLIIDKVYLSDPAGIEFIPGAIEALHRARSLGYLLFLFTNQSGIGRGYFTLEDALRVHHRLEALIGLPPPCFDEVCMAPEAPDQPILYRKPSPRFILETMRKYGLAPEECTMVGDAESDLRAALAAGIRPIAVRTGKIDPLGLPVVADHRITVYDTIADFASTLR